MEKQWGKAAQGDRGSDPLLCKMKSAMGWEISGSRGRIIVRVAWVKQQVICPTAQSRNRPFFCVKLSAFLVVKIDCYDLAIIELLSLAIGLIFGYDVPCCAHFGCPVTDLSLNMSLCFSSIDFSARRPPQETNGSEVRENVRHGCFCQSSSERKSCSLTSSHSFPNMYQ